MLGYRHFSGYWQYIIMLGYRYVSGYWQYFIMLGYRCVSGYWQYVFMFRLQTCQWPYWQYTIMLLFDLLISNPFFLINVMELTSWSDMCSLPCWLSRTPFLQQPSLLITPLLAIQSPMVDGYFPQPTEGESLMSFLSSQDFATCPELDRVSYTVKESWISNNGYRSAVAPWFDYLNIRIM